MFSAFLSKDMTYSCGIFQDLDGDLLKIQDVGENNGGLGLMKFGKTAKNSKQANGTRAKANGNHAKSNEELESDAEIDELEEAQLRKIRYAVSIPQSACLTV